MDTLLSQLISADLTKNIVNAIPKCSLLKKFEGEREEKIREKSIQYMHGTFSQINNIKQIKYSVPSPNEIDEHREDHFISINPNLNKNNVHVYRRQSKDVNSGSQAKHQNHARNNKRRESKFVIDKKKLVKLSSDSDEDVGYAEYVQKLREKKIRLAQAMGEFEKSEDDLIKNIFDNPIKQANSQLKPLITNFQGEVLKSDRKNMGNSKKQNSLWSQKNKVRPVFKLKESLYTQKDLSRSSSEAEFVRQGQTSPISSLKAYDLDEKNKEDNALNIKSIIDVYTSKNILDGKRSRRIFNLR